MTKNTHFPFKMDIPSLAFFTSQDENQLADLQLLADKRNYSVKFLRERGIFYVPNFDEIEVICQSFNIEPHEMGVDRSEMFIYEGGYLIPITDTRGRIVYYLNYSFTRESNKKYIMVHSSFVVNDVELRFYGLHNFKKALELGHMVIVEGVFDAMRLEMYGIPVVAILGTKVNDYQKNFLSRFPQVTFITDNDTSGEYSYYQYSKVLPNLTKFDIHPSYEDVDHFGSKGDYLFDRWIAKLKERIKLPN